MTPPTQCAFTSAARPLCLQPSRRHHHLEGKKKDDRQRSVYRIKQERNISIQHHGLCFTMAGQGSDWGQVWRIIAFRGGGQALVAAVTQQSSEADGGGSEDKRHSNSLKKEKKTPSCFVCT